MFLLTPLTKYISDMGLNRNCYYQLLLFVQDTLKIRHLLLVLTELT